MIEKDKLTICQTPIEGNHSLMVYVNKNGELFERVLLYFSGDDAVWCEVDNLPHYKIKL